MTNEKINLRAQAAYNALLALDSEIYSELDLGSDHPLVVRMNEISAALCEVLDAVGADYDETPVL